jgi:hypothetical protein
VTVPVKRRLSKQREGAITPDLVRRWRRAKELAKQASLSPAHRDLAYTAECDLNRALGLRLWDYSVLDDMYFTSGEPPAYLEKQAPARIPIWRRVHELRQQIEAAA